MPSKYSKKRSAAHSYQAGFCYYCKVKMWQKSPDDFAKSNNITLKQTTRFQCTAEHLTARQDGGGDTQENIAAACLFCNQKRHQRGSPLTAKEYKKHVMKRIRNSKWHPQDLHKLVNPSAYA